MVTTCAALRLGIKSGVGECTTSNSCCVNASTAGHSCRCHSQFRTRTGTRKSIVVTPADDSHGESRSFQELLKTVTSGVLGPDASASASTSLETQSPTPEGFRTAGR